MLTPRISHWLEYTPVVLYMTNYNDKSSVEANALTIS